MQLRLRICRLTLQKARNQLHRRRHSQSAIKAILPALRLPFRTLIGLSGLSNNSRGHILHGRFCHTLNKPTHRPRFRQRQVRRWSPLSKNILSGRWENTEMERRKSPAKMLGCGLASQQLFGLLHSFMLSILLLTVLCSLYAGARCFVEKYSSFGDRVPKL